jgi:indolepyruvate ferredoxin oxidoreductase
VTIASKVQFDRQSEIVSGTQALVHGMIAQAKLDRSNGLNTAGFVSGYRGSPFGNVDFELWRDKEGLDAHNILFQPGLNEDMAATACWGTQQVGLMSTTSQYDGVFAFWYGKGPGVDRAGDALKHGNYAGTSPKGGVVVLAGDDHGAKSSSTAHQSEPALIASGMPVFNASTIDEYAELLPTAVALSRFSSLWVGFKCPTEIVEASGMLPMNAALPSFVYPEIEAPAGGFHIARKFAPLVQEETLHRFRLPAARAFVAANGLDRVPLESPRRTLGIVAPGKSFVDVQEALRLLDIDDEQRRSLGIRVFKPLMTWPLEPTAARAFSAGHREVFVIEEKRNLVEGQLAQILLGLPNDARPALSGKMTPDGRFLLAAHGELAASAIAPAIGARLIALGMITEQVQTALARLEERGAGDRRPGPLARAPMFCSGCPHNRSTRLPDGSEAIGGIGCHGMAMWIPELNTMPGTHMGGEGGTWLGISPFGGPEHMFQNMGDGTYAHSGSLSIRAAIAAKVNITFKILCNSAVAMTGGQPVEGSPDAGAIALQTLAEGPERVALVSENPSAFSHLPPQIKVYGRDELMRVQEELREVKGVTILVYDQGCAAERRRLRKKGDYPDLPIRTFINSDVCEGCGDCNAKSSCVSVLPLETELGTKRFIEQESCNKDYTCVEGFCPSFVTVTGGAPKGGSGGDDLLEALTARLGAPVPPRAIDETFNVVLAGIGGTGVVTLGGILARAASAAGLKALTFDVTGVSQKNGAVFSHIRFIEKSSGGEFRPRVPAGQLDLLVGCDIIASTAAEIMQLLSSERTQAVVNADLVPTLDFQRQPDLDRSSKPFKESLGQILDERAITYLTPGPAVTDVIGVGPLLNIFLLGAACQQGRLPLGNEALEAAIGKGRGGNKNLLAYRMGRLAVHDRDGLDDLLKKEAPVVPLAERPYEEVVARCGELLRDYQSAAYAERYRKIVEGVRAKDAEGAFSFAVALNLFKLMRYKDEYEVARLYASSDFHKRVAKAFEGEFKLSYNLAPPIISRRKNAHGEPTKVKFGPWTMTLFRTLQRFKVLRGTPLDPFGYFADRKLERNLIRTYLGWIGDITDRLASVDYEAAVAIAALPDKMRGYGPVKERNVAQAMQQYEELVARLTDGGVNHGVSSALLETRSYQAMPEVVQ